MNEVFHYMGEELDLFAKATNWKLYWSSFVSPYLGNDILDVGAGVGATAKLLASPRHERWLALEPDPTLAERINKDIVDGFLPTSCEVRVGTLSGLPNEENFDTIIYADVLEHIEQDEQELAIAASHLKSGGHLIVLSPAIQWLYTPFDEAIGHFRRYSKRTLRAIAPPSLAEVRVVYLDAVGMAASIGNKLVLNSALPTARQISFWDGALVPMSRIVDPIVSHSFGKSIIAIWKHR